VCISEPFGSVGSILSIQANNHVRPPQLLFRCGYAGEAFRIERRMMYLLSLSRQFAKDSFRPRLGFCQYSTLVLGPGVVPASCPLLLFLFLYGEP